MMKENRILFLDIDGVLETQKVYSAFGCQHKFDVTSCYSLLNLMKEKGITRIVLHSTWRYIENGYERFRECLLKECPEMEVYLYPDDSEKRMTVGDGYISKEESIDGWLEKYSDEENVVGYLIIDDDRIIITKQYLEPHFHLIDNPLDGFGLIDYFRCTRKEISIN